MKPSHFLLAIFVVFIWGLNFVIIRVGLNGFPPLLLGAVRFALAAFPWVFFLPRPQAPFKFIFGYGLFTFTLQFAFLFSGIHLGLPPGLSSLVLQVQAFFSMGLAALFFHDRPSLWKIFGALISFFGIGIVAAHMGGSTSFLGLGLTLIAAFCWASGNMFSKKVDARSSLSLVVWGSLVAFPIMTALSIFMEGPALIQASFQNVSFPTVGAVLYLVYLSTHLGYSAWGFLLNTYPTAVVVPFTLLVPVFGFLGSALFLGEELPQWKIVASLFVMVGLAFNLLEKQIRAWMIRAS
ncbi:MAG TPA: EamA family transporter [Oligoflexus sp.]|uniref:EamA family transporter n=1 Tax=Oligoflexus sp. TaxID=1971216 RepID=UPI002D5EA374|nr:EamA family transporter [Oligoflexus sp.]HYX36514.1 EamA family transporter [Oligoflexus sp.]